MEGVVVRRAAWADRSAVTELIAGMGGHAQVAQGRDPLRQLALVLAQPSVRALVAVVEGGIRGYAEIQARPSTLHDRQEAWLAALAVAEGSRGEGIGRALVEAAVREAQILGCQSMVLESSQWRTGAHAFYRGLGFEEGSPAARLSLELGPGAGGAADDFLTAAARAASAASAALGGFVGLQTRGKEADLEAEAAAVGELLPLGIPILSEESGSFGGQLLESEDWIILDPLDGSRNLRAGLAPWAFSAALIRRGWAIAGLVVDLASNRRWWAEAERGAWVDGEPCRPRPGGLVSLASRPPGEGVQGLPVWAQRNRASGSSCVDLCRVADGSLAAFAGTGSAVIHPQDVAAAGVILQTAGASLIDASGAFPLIVPDRNRRLQVVAAATSQLADELRQACGLVTAVGGD